MYTFFLKRKKKKQRANEFRIFYYLTTKHKAKDKYKYFFIAI